MTSDGKLTLRGADASDTGLYRCVATNYLDADVLIFRVTVLSPDVEEADVNGVQISREIGENLVFDCSTSGSSEASVHWILPDQSVIEESHGNKVVYENGTLLIEGLTVRDRGFYRCLVANPLGVDMVVSQVTVTDIDNEGSGMEMEVDQTLTGNKETLSEFSPSSSSERNIQESKTITSDRPYPRLRSQAKGGSGVRLGQRRRGPFSNRRMWGSRVFDKAARKVDPEKFAELMKKAEDGARVKTGTEKEKVKRLDSQTIFSGDDEIGSGGNHDEDHLITVPTTVKPTTDNPQKGTIFGQENRQSEIITTTESNQGGFVERAGTHQTHGMESGRVSSHLDISHGRENKNILTTVSYLQSDSTPIKSIFTHDPTESDAVKQYSTISHNTGVSTFDETRELHSVERTTEPSSGSPPVNLQLTVTDSSQETQLQLSEGHKESETSTAAATAYTTDPNITPMRDGTGPVELFIHTDPESQTTFTAVTTKRQQDHHITFHTTQTIKSPHLPPGSTIISEQQIHIIPHKKGRGGGRRRTYPGHRRIIKPNRITDIQSFINKLKQTSVKKEANATVPSRIEMSTGKLFHM